MNNFYVGQKVVCLNNIWDRVPRKFQKPKRGEIYTIRNIYFDAMENLVGVHLVEIVNPKYGDDVPQYKGFEIGWAARQFRPLVEKKTDISIFKKMLNPSRLERV